MKNDKLTKIKDAARKTFLAASAAMAVGCATHDKAVKADTVNSARLNEIKRTMESFGVSADQVPLTQKGIMTDMNGNIIFIEKLARLDNKHNLPIEVTINNATDRQRKAIDDIIALHNEEFSVINPNYLIKVILDEQTNENANHLIINCAEHTRVERISGYCYKKNKIETDDEILLYDADVQIVTAIDTPFNHIKALAAHEIYHFIGGYGEGYRTYQHGSIPLTRMNTTDEDIETGLPSPPDIVADFAKYGDINNPEARLLFENYLQDYTRRFNYALDIETRKSTGDLQR